MADELTFPLEIAKGTAVVRSFRQISRMGRERFAMARFGGGEAQSE
jgi:hypothetical protein